MFVLPMPLLTFAAVFSLRFGKWGCTTLSQNTAAKEFRPEESVLQKNIILNVLCLYYKCLGNSKSDGSNFDF